MIFHSNRQKLAQILYQARRVAPKNPIIPATACVRLTATEYDTLVIQITDTRIGLTCETDASVEEPGVVATSVGGLYGIIFNMLGSDIRIASGKNHAVHVSSGGQKSRMVGLPLREFLNVERYSGDGVILDAKKFKWMADRALFAAAKDNTRMILNGVLIDITAGDAVMAGADGHRMSIVRAAEIAPPDVDSNVVVPLWAITMISSTMRSGDISMTIADSGRIMFACGEYEIASQVISGQYPDYNVLMPRIPGAVANVRHDELDSAVGLGISTIDEYTLHCTFTFDKDMIEMNASSQSFGETETKIPAKITGLDKPIRVGVRAQYLKEAIALIDTPTVNIGVSGPIAPILITAEPDDGFLHILMPSQIM